MLLPEEHLLCGLLVSRGLISGERLSACTTLVEEEPSRSLGDTLADLGHIDRQLLGELLREAGRLLAARFPASSVQELDRIGPYRLVGELGRGGMGTVFEAEDERSGRHVALKVLSEVFGGPRSATLFEREIAAERRLEHPGIVRLLDAGRAPGVLFYAMELVRGTSLQEILRAGPLASSEAARVANDVAEAVAYAHGRGVIHRDIKPANILIGDDDVVKITDFGIAHDVDADTLSTAAALLGTPSFMCVEQACGDDPLPSHDVYAIGAALYAMLTGRPPYPGDLAVAVLVQLVTREPQPVPEIRPDCPPGLAAICEMAMARRPGDRYATAGALAEDLRRFRSGQAPLALQRTPMHEDEPRRENHRRTLRSALSVAGVLLLVTAAGLVGAWWTKRSPSDAPPSWINATRQTFTPDREVFPTFHPDGEHYAYAVNGGIWLARLHRTGATSAADPELLTRGIREYCTECSFSPDGKQIAFRRGTEGGIHLLDLATREMRPITSSGFNPSWSPDGRSIVHTMLPAVGNGRGDELSEMWIVEVATGARRRLTSMKGAHPRWSPAGHRIAFWSNNKHGSTLWTIPAEGGQPVAASDGRFREWNPVWSPDGAFLYFASDRSGWTNIWRVAIDERTGATRKPPTAVTTDISALSYHPAFTADGGRLIFARWTYNDRVVAFVLDRATGDVESGPSTPIPFQGVHRHPSVSPDGGTLAFTLDDRYVHLALFRIGSEDAPRTVASAPSLDDQPRWSPDGRWIAFESNREGTPEIWVAHPDGTGLRRVTASAGRSAFGPFWSPDGRQLGFSIERQGTWLVPFDPETGGDGAAAEALPPAPFQRSFVGTDWSPDGERIIGNCGFDAVIYELRSGTYRKLAESGREPIWLPDGERALFVRDGALWIARADGGQPERLVYSSKTLRLGGRMSLTRDGRTLYATEARSESDLWLLTRADAD